MSTCRSLAATVESNVLPTWALTRRSSSSESARRLNSPHVDALDVARFIRESGIPAGDMAQVLRDKGVSTQRDRIRDGMRLASLPEDVWTNIYANGDVPGVKGIASALAEHFGFNPDL